MVNAYKIIFACEEGESSICAIDGENQRCHYFLVKTIVTFHSVVFKNGASNTLGCSFRVMYDSELTLKLCSFVDNVATATGTAAIFVGFGFGPGTPSYDRSIVNIYASYFSGNTASYPTEGQSDVWIYGGDVYTFACPPGYVGGIPGSDIMESQFASKSMTGTKKVRCPSRYFRT